MANYFVSKLGNDSSAGTSAGAAWLTVDKAASTATGGDTVYVAPGVYRELVTNDNSGDVSYATSPEGADYIRFVGDTSCEKFVGIAGITPGIVRITQAAAVTEIGADPSSNTYVWNMNGKSRIQIHNFVVDGIAGSVNSTSTPTSYGIRNSSGLAGTSIHNCTAQGNTYAMYNAGLIYDKCFTISRNTAVYTAGAEFNDCVSIGGLYAFSGYASRFRNCIGFGYICYNISGGTNELYNCISIGGLRGFHLSHNGVKLDGCIAMGASNGFLHWSAAGTTRLTNCAAINCVTAYYKQHITNCYVVGCGKAYGGASTAPDSGGDAAPTETGTPVWTMENLRMIQKAFKPFQAVGFQDKGDHTQMSGSAGSWNISAAINRGIPGVAQSPDPDAEWTTDVLGRNRNNSSTGTPTGDIGPWEYTTVSGSTNASDYRNTAPGINIQGRGEVPFEIAVPSGSSITASVYAKTTDADYPPRLVLRPLHTYTSLYSIKGSGSLTDITTDIAAGSSWADNSFQELTVQASTLVRDQLLELVISGAAGANVTSSFSDFNIVVTGSA